jgi:hypothetical protein
MATKLEILSQADKIVSAQITQRRPPMFDTLKSVYAQLGELASVSKGLRADGEGLPSEFAGGINDVIRSLSAFRSGYASNDPSQVVAGTVTKRASLAEFVGYVKTEIEKSIKEEAPEALSRLRAVSGVIKAGLAELDAVKDNGAEIKENGKVVAVSGGIAKADGGVTIPVTNDPMQVKTTETPAASAMLPAGTSSPSTAPSNFAANPGDITTPPPATTPNPSTASALATAGTGTGGQAAAPFSGTADPAFLAGAAAGTAASTSGVAAVANGATNSGEDATSFSPDAIAKSAADLEKGVEEMRKAAEKTNGRKRDGWSLDLNSREFLKGERSIDFGSDATPASK